MEYYSAAAAEQMPGLRLVLTAGMLGPWSECAKGIFFAKGIPFVPVRQQLGAENADLVTWTGVRNAPVAVLDSERPLDRWLDIAMLAERMKPEPALLPSSSEDRALVVGIANEIHGEWGFGWCRRAMLVGAVRAGKVPPNPDNNVSAARRAADEATEFGYTPEVIVASQQRAIDILRMLTSRLKAQRLRNSPYLVGANLSIADIFWACFSALLDPLPSELCPMTDWFRALYTAPPELDTARDPILLEHRDFIYKNHLKLPLEF